MDRIYKSDIQRMIDHIANQCGYPTTQKQAKEEEKEEYLKYNYNSYYGGYELVLAKTDGGAQYGAFGGNYGRMKAGVFYMYLQGLYNGLNHSK